MIGQGRKRADECDVVVVGAGLVGAAVAARLTAEGLDTAVLEAQTVAGGATGRSAGLVLAGCDFDYGRAVATYGRQRARELWSLTVEGRERLVAEARHLAVPVTVSGSWALATDAEQAARLEKAAALLREDGFDVRFGDDPLERGFQGALYTPGDAVVDGAALTRALLASEGVAVHETTEVYRWEPEGNGLRVWARGRTVFCHALVLAVNGYSPLLASYFTGRVTPTRGRLVTSDPLYETTVERPCVFDGGYCRQLPDRRLLLGGWQRETDGDGLAEFVARHFPEVNLLTAEQRSGVGGFTGDGIPLVGRLPDAPNVHFAVGLGGRGLAWGLVVAERVTSLLLHDTDPGLLAASRQ